MILVNIGKLSVTLPQITSQHKFQTWKTYFILKKNIRIKTGPASAEHYNEFAEGQYHHHRNLGVSFPQL